MDAGGLLSMETFPALGQRDISSAPCLLTSDSLFFSHALRRRGPGSNVGHIFVNLTAESRPFPAVGITRSGNGRDAACNNVAEDIIKPGAKMIQL